MAASSHGPPDDSLADPVDVAPAAQLPAVPVATPRKLFKSSGAPSKELLKPFVLQPEPPSPTDPHPSLASPLESPSPTAPEVPPEPTHSPSKPCPAGESTNCSDGSTDCLPTEALRPAEVVPTAVADPLSPSVADTPQAEPPATAPAPPLPDTPPDAAAAAAAEAATSSSSSPAPAPAAEPLVPSQPADHDAPTPTPAPPLGVWVGHLPGVTDQALRQFFSDEGVPVQGVARLNDDSCVYRYLELPTPAAVEAARALGGRAVGGHPLRVGLSRGGVQPPKEAKTSSKHPSSPPPRRSLGEAILPNPRVNPAAPVVLLSRALSVPLAQRTRRHRVCVNSITEGVTDVALRDAFKAAGPVAHVRLFASGGNSLGAVLSYDSAEAAACSVLLLNGRLLGVNIISVYPSPDNFPQWKFRPASPRVVFAHNVPTGTTKECMQAALEDEGFVPCGLQLRPPRGATCSVFISFRNRADAARLVARTQPAPSVYVAPVPSQPPRPPPPAPSGPSKFQRQLGTVTVHGLPPIIGEPDVLALFETLVGPIVAVEIQGPAEPRSCTVEFERPSLARAAARLDGYRWGDHELRIRLQVPQKRPRASEPPSAAPTAKARRVNRAPTPFVIPVRPPPVLP
eukprot:EG_transcript_6695